MSATLNVLLKVTGNGTLTNPTLTGSLTGASDAFSIGANSLDAITISYTSGTGDNQANQWYVLQRTVTAGGNTDLDLAATLTNRFGQTITFAKVRTLILKLRSKTASTDYLQVGPQGVTNGWQGPWSAVDADSWIRVDSLLILDNPTDNGIGAVTSGSADVLRLNCPGANNVTVDVLIFGVE